MVQRLEGDLKRSLNECTNLWVHKLQVNMMAHHKTPADYLVLSAVDRYLIECKEVDCRRHKGSFSFKRLVQLRLLLEFDKKHTHNKAIVMVSFRHRRLKASACYMIPINEYITMTEAIGKLSASQNDFEVFLGDWRVNIIGSTYKLVL